MRPKEAQILGVLALVATAIIVVCLWTGKDEPAEARAQVAPQDISEFESPPAPGLQDLVNEMERQQRQRDAAAAGGGEVAPMVIEGDGLAGSSPDDPDPHPVAPEPAGEPRPRPVAPPATDVPAAARFHVVQKGDTLWEISENYYKSGTHWRKIEAANKGRVPDPNNLKINTKLVVPPLAALGRSAGTTGSGSGSTLSTTGVLAGGKKYYEVRKGDTFWSIAVKQYGDASRLKELQEANADLVKDPKRDLKTGMRLILP